MNRRELIKLVSLTTGSVLSAPLLSSLLTACETGAKSATDYQCQFFDQKEFALIQELVDLIIPETESPSATKMGVDQMVDQMLSQVYSERDQKAYREKFKMLSDYLANAEAYQRKDNSSKVDVLKQLSASDERESKWARQAFLDLRQQTIAYYLTSEEIGKNYLNYLPVPGKYEPCISLSEVDNRAWAF